MPLYEYKCSTCGDVFEVIQKFSDEPLKVHESCGGPLERLISVSALQFKGTGFYITDYGKGHSKDPKPKGDKSNGSGGSEKSSGESKSGESSGKAEKSESKSESKTETKSESKSEKSGKSESSSSTGSTTNSSKSDTK